MTAGQAAGLVVFPTVHTPVSRSPYSSSVLFSLKLQPWWTWTSMPVVNSPRMDIRTVNGRKVILPGSFYLITPGPWNPGTSTLTGIVYPDCIIVNPT